MAIAELTGQRNSAGAGAVTTISAIFPSNPIQGNLLVACLSWRGDTTISGVPSGWNLATAGGNGSGIDSAIYYKIAGAGEGTTHTFTLAASNKTVLVASEWSGIAASPLDKTNNNSGTGIAGTCGLTGTLAQADELVICAFSNINTNTWASYDNSAAEVLEIASTGGSTSTRNNTAMSSRIVSATTSINYGATLSGSQIWSAAVATFKADLTQSLTQSSRFDNSSTFYAPTVTPGEITLSPPLLTNANVFYSPEVTYSGLDQSLTQSSRLDNSQTFYNPTVTPGEVTLLPGLVTNTNVFYTPEVTPGPVSLLPSRFDNDQIFYSPTVTYAGADQSLVQASRLDNSQEFYNPTVTPGEVTLLPGLVTNTNVFYAPSVTPGPVSLLPSRFDNDQIFYSPIVVPGEVTLVQDELLTNQQIFYVPVVERMGTVRVTTPAYFVQIDFSTVLRLSSRGEQSWNGYTWTSGRLGKIQIGSNGGYVELMNGDLLSGALTLNEGIADRAVSIWAFDGDNPASPTLIFAGVGDKLDIGADKVRITLITENRRTLYSPRRFVNAVSGFNHLLPAGTRISWGGQTFLLDRK